MQFEIALLHFFERSGIDPICVTNSTRAVWTRILSQQKLFRNCIYPQSVNMVLSKDFDTVDHIKMIKKLVMYSIKDINFV